MKTWLKPILCVGILASGLTTMDNMKVQASEVVDQESISEEEGYELHSTQPFLKERLEENFDDHTATYAIILNNGAVQGIELPQKVFSKYLRQNPGENPEAANGWEIKIYTKNDVEGKAEFFDQRGKHLGTKMFTIEN